MNIISELLKKYPDLKTSLEITVRFDVIFLFLTVQLVIMKSAIRANQNAMRDMNNA